MPVFDNMNLEKSKTRLIRLVSLLSIIITVSACAEKEDTCDGCKLISEFQSKTNHSSAIRLLDDKYLADMQSAKLNGEVVSFDPTLSIEEPDFYDLVISYNEGQTIVTDTFLFVITNPDRGATEWGLKTWIPSEFSEDVLTIETVEMVHPAKYLEDIYFPVVVNIIDAGKIKPLYIKSVLNGKPFNIKRGRGSLSLDLSSTNQVALEVSGNNQNRNIEKNQSDLIELPATLVGEVLIPAYGVVHISSDIDIPESSSLIFSEGSIVKVDEGVTIRNRGSVEFNGSEMNPILVTCSEKGKYWGGFISSGSSAGITAKNTFFCYSGYNTSSEHNYGHAQRQALFKLENTTIDVENSYFIDHIGQLFYPTHSELDIRNVFVQRVKTSGEISSSNLRLSNSFFTDFPDDSQNFRDEDNDALYISNSNATITNCTFMYAKDDGVDSGSDNGGGVIEIADSHFEAIFHEGAALSSYDGVKTHTISGSTFQNCGQGIELGFSSANHNVIIDNCLIQKNLIGIRYGDNYQSSDLNGRMQIKNSLSIDNIKKDIWNMGHKRWSPTIENLNFESTYVSTLSEQYPEVELYPN